MPAHGELAIGFEIDCDVPALAAGPGMDEVGAPVTRFKVERNA